MELQWENGVREHHRSNRGIQLQILHRKGRTGSVYKAELSTGQVVAMKKLHANTDSGHEMSQYLKAFTSEIHTLTQIQHRNIVKLYGFCSHRGHSLLLYEFIEGGSLQNLLNNEDEARAFNWRKSKRCQRCGKCTILYAP